MHVRLFVFSFLLFVIPRLAAAEIIQAPVGGKSIGLGDARVACPSAAGRWTIEPGGHAVRPPSNDEAIGRAVDLKVAATPGECSTSKNTVTLLATGRWPDLDFSTVVFTPDEARMEARGRHLKGIGIAWQTPTGIAVDVCQDPKLEPNTELCSWAVGQGLSASPGAGVLSWIPAGGRAGADVRTFDQEGKSVPPVTFTLTPARIVLDSLLPADSAIDLSTGRGEVPISHVEAIASVECGPAHCELSGSKLVVKGLSAGVNAIDVKLRLAPHVFLQKKDGADAQPVAHLTVLHCHMSIVSGPPLRGNDSSKVVVRTEGRCAREVSSLRFLVGSVPADVIETDASDNGAYVLLHIGNVDTPSLTVTATRIDDPTVTVAVARADTQPNPVIRTALELPGHPNTNFIPNNRSIIVHFPTLDGGAKLVVLPVEGVYSVRQDGSITFVQGDPNAAGLTALRFAYREPSLPGRLGQTDLATLVDPLQRSIHEANLPAPIGPSSFAAEPLVELVCANEEHTLARVMPGETAHLPFDARDSCRLIFHRERLSPEYGTQKLNLDIEVINSDGNGRAEGHVSQTIVLRAGDEPRFAWIHGVKAPFDRISVRLSQAADEAHYVGGLDIPTGAPDVKWTAVLGTGHARLYATSAIPTGLYRFGDAAHSGVLSLNFGIVSRLTWLDRDGHEGFLGLEAGIMAIGLTNDKSPTGQSLTQIGVIGGIGISVPIANRSTPTEAAINLHAWVEEDVSSHSGSDAGSRFAVIFGPSISIGNVGTNL
jgi:hypothetical protein